jgi:hypothetical protein
VRVATRRTSRFNGLALRRKPLKRFPTFLFADTGLKPGVNEKTTCIFHAL